MGSRLIFMVVVFLNIALRMVVKAHKARLRPRGEIHKPKLLLEMVLAYVFFCILAFSESLSGLWTMHPGVSIAGVFLFVAANGLQWRAFHDLGDAYSPDIEVRREQTLVCHGLYRIVRHPLLTALILELAGVTLVFNAYGTFILSAAIFIPVIEKRRREEEKVLQKHFGHAYQVYASQVGALVPKPGGFIHD